MAPPILLGPPELYKSAWKINSDDKSINGPFVDSMVANFNKVYKPPRGFTENRSATFLSSGNPCLDFFFRVVPDTPPESLTERLICNLRGVRGTGKSEKEGFYTAAIWLHKHHPKTSACNILSLAGSCRKSRQRTPHLFHNPRVIDFVCENLI